MSEWHKLATKGDVCVGATLIYWIFRSIEGLIRELFKKSK